MAVSNATLPNGTLAKWSHIQQWFPRLTVAHWVFLSFNISFICHLLSQPFWCLSSCIFSSMLNINIHALFFLFQFSASSFWGCSCLMLWFRFYVRFKKTKKKIRTYLWLLLSVSCKVNVLYFSHIKKERTKEKKLQRQVPNFRLAEFSSYCILMAVLWRRSMTSPALGDRRLFSQCQDSLV